MLTVDDYATIRLAHRDGMSIREIARTFHHSRRKIRQILQDISAAVPHTPGVSKFSADGSQELLTHNFDRTAIARKKLPYERLDQLTIDILAGVR